MNRLGSGAHYVARHNCPVCGHWDDRETPYCPSCGARVFIPSIGRASGNSSPGFTWGKGGRDDEIVADITEEPDEVVGSVPGPEAVMRPPRRASGPSHQTGMLVWLIGLGVPVLIVGMYACICCRLQGCL